MKSITVSTFPPIYLPLSDGTRCYDLHFLNVEFCQLLHSLYIAQIFLHFSCIFTFLEIIKHNIPKKKNKVQAIKEKISCTSSKLKTFCISKDIITKVKRQPSQWEEIFASS